MATIECEDNSVDHLQEDKLMMMLLVMVMVRVMLM